MMIKTETTVVFKYPEERDAEIAFTHDNGTDEWNATRKERITRCGDCLFYSQALLGTPYGYCKGRRKFEAGFCDEAIRRR